MGALDLQLGLIDEVTFNTAPVVTRFQEYNGDAVPIKPVAGRTEGNPLRVGTRARRTSRTVPYFHHGEGTIPFDAMDKGLGFWLKHMLPSVATTGSGPYVHTATEGTSSAPMGKSFAAQLNAPFHPTGTNQAITYSGGKVTKWKIGNDVDSMLAIDLDVWFAGMTTATALATASYPSTMTNFSWAGAVVRIGGATFDATSIAIECDAGYNLDRQQLRDNTDNKEPTPGPLGLTWSIEADFDSLAQYSKVYAATAAGIMGTISGKWTAGTSSLEVSLPLARFDEFEFGGDPGSLTQSFSGVGEGDTGVSAATLIYTTSDTTP